MKKHQKSCRIFGKIFLGVLIFLESALAVILSAFSILLGNSIIWMFDTWSYLTMDELMYQLRAPIDGTNQDLILDYIRNCVPGALIALLLVLFLMVGLRKSRKLYCGVLALVIAASVLFAAHYLKFAWDELDIENYSKNSSTYSTFIDDNYVNPLEVNLEFPEKKRNLIYIFLESMETTYADKEAGGGFEEGCIPELARLAQENEDFSGSDDALNGARVMPKATWTVAGMFAQSAGLPLDIPISNNAMSSQDTFFPGVTMIGDILKDAGYSQRLLIGSKATFAGRDKMFGTHGDFTIHDYEYASEMQWIPEDYYVWWGYEDERLFEFAKEELLELSQSEEPFNFTMLTVDTHFEDGYYCDICRDEFSDNPYADVMACSSRQVDRFIKWIQRQDFYENTTIVLSGDHLTMDSDFCEDVDKEYERKVYTTYINPAVSVQDPEKRREFTTFDQFPTTLASLGVEIEGNQLGLGTNLFSKELTLTERYSEGRMERELSRQSRLMEEFATDVIESVKRQEEEARRAPQARITPLEYDYEISAHPLRIWSFKNIPNRIAAVNVAVWKEADQSDLNWMQAEEQEDGSYMVYLHMPDIDYLEEGYHIHVYAIDETGEQYWVAVLG